MVNRDSKWGEFIATPPTGRRDWGFFSAERGLLFLAYEVDWIGVGVGTWAGGSVDGTLDYRYS